MLIKSWLPCHAGWKLYPLWDAAFMKEMIACIISQDTPIQMNMLSSLKSMCIYLYLILGAGWQRQVMTVRNHQFTSLYIHLLDIGCNSILVAISYTIPSPYQGSLREFHITLAMGYALHIKMDIWTYQTWIICNLIILASLTKVNGQNIGLINWHYVICLIT